MRLKVFFTSLSASYLISHLGIFLDYRNQEKYGYEYSLYEYNALSAISAPGVFLSYSIGSALNSPENSISSTLDHVACLLNGVIYALLITVSVKAFKDKY